MFKEVRLTSVNDIRNFANLPDDLLKIKLEFDSQLKENFHSKKRLVVVCGPCSVDDEKAIICSSVESESFILNTSLKIEYDGADQLDYSAEDGDKIGVVKYYFEDELLYEQNVVLKDDIEVHFGKWLGAHWYLIILFIIVFLFVVMLCIRAHNLRKRKK